MSKQSDLINEFMAKSDDSSIPAPTPTYPKACFSCNKPQSQVSGSECDRCHGTLCYTCCSKQNNWSSIYGADTMTEMSVQR